MENGMTNNEVNTLIDFKKVAYVYVCGDGERVVFGKLKWVDERKKRIAVVNRHERIVFTTNNVRAQGLVIISLDHIIMSDIKELNDELMSSNYSRTEEFV